LRRRNFPPTGMLSKPPVTRCRIHQRHFHQTLSRKSVEGSSAQPVHRGGPSMKSATRCGLSRLKTQAAAIGVQHCEYAWPSPRIRSGPADGQSTVRAAHRKVTNAGWSQGLAPADDREPQSEYGDARTRVTAFDSYVSPGNVPLTSETSKLALS
jgi:hypothetical protein